MTTLTFKVTVAEARRMRTVARREKISVSELLRRKVAVPRMSGAKPRHVRDVHTGASLFSGLPGQPPLTMEAVRSMLGEFP